jgi:hypothetical protein
LHKNPIPKPIKNGEIIYNGISTQDVQGRIRAHLASYMSASWSGISVDIYCGKSRSHRKLAYDLTANRKKSAFIANAENTLQPIDSQKLACKLFLSAKEKKYISSRKKAHFRNGIDVLDNKHRRYIYKVYFITAISAEYTEIIEKRWREKYGQPRLCSYKKGR